MLRITSAIPIGSYQAWLGLDLEPNGNLNIPKIWTFDDVDFEVVP